MSDYTPATFYNAVLRYLESLPPKERAELAAGLAQDYAKASRAENAESCVALPGDFKATC